MWELSAGWGGKKKREKKQPSDKLDVLKRSSAPNTPPLTPPTRCFACQMSANFPRARDIWTDYFQLGLLCFSPSAGGDGAKRHPRERRRGNLCNKRRRTLVTIEGYFIRVLVADQTQFHVTSTELHCYTLLLIFFFFPLLLVLRCMRLTKAPAREYLRRHFFLVSKSDRTIVHFLFPSIASSQCRLSLCLPLGLKVRAV